MLMRQSKNAFTIAELLVSIAVLALLVLVVSKMVNSASTITTMGNKHMDADTQARLVLDRMAVDFAQMIRRTDVDAYVKGTDPENGNDYIGFFSQVSGYYPSPSYQSPISLVAYRINSNSNSPSFNKMERMGNGLLWNSSSSTYKPLVFGAPPTTSPAPLAANWPNATSTSAADPNYELIGPNIFRFEYFFLLNTGTLANSPPGPGMQNVTAIVVTIAAIDPKSRVLLSDNQVSTLAGQMNDFSLNMHQPGNTPTQPGDLVAQWQLALDLTTNMPRAAITGIRLYQRSFYFSHP
jgi:hypothetical protein